ncbi:MAG: hypothetical protein JNJ56_06790 [Ignavibacteria bacterium]|nr:hypothetical protein [Ignavibacteria bacterium]
MKKNYFLILNIALIFAVSGNTFPQHQNILNPELKLKLHQDKSNNASNDFIETLLIVFPLNPVFQLQDKRFYAGITKEISFGFYPYGRIAAEYSLIFRKTRLNQLRASYNLDLPLESGDFYAFLLSVGAGYFTDFTDEGFFPQASLNLFLPVFDEIAVPLYFKIRETFMTKDKPDIFDISFGFGLYLKL